MSAAAVHRRQLHRLRALGVELIALGAAARRRHLARFADVFVDPLRRDAFMAALSRGRPIDYDRFFRVESLRRPVPAGASLAWLAETHRADRCLRFERDAALPALEIQLASLHEIWATTWPGALVSFATGRALVITLDYERIHCDVTGAPTPYR